MTSCKDKWIAELGEAQKTPILVILEEVLMSQWEEREQVWIERFGPTLTTGTAGGRAPFPTRLNQRTG
jgi:hypothetical protein